MKITLIAAVDKNDIIGNGDRIPWKCSGDMKHFKVTTLNHVVILGRKTWESFGSKPLPNRRHIILSRNPKSVDLSKVAPKDLVDEVVCVVTNIEEAIATAKDIDVNGNVFVIGGAEIYKQFLPYADEAILSTIYGEFEGDVYFPSEFYSQFHQYGTMLEEQEFHVVLWKKSPTQA